MKGDFSRFTFDRARHYSRVLMQQGRVQLDADWNEQAALLLYRLETMVKDIIGPFGGPPPEKGGGFDLQLPEQGQGTDFIITRGRYYVEGRLCENEADVAYSKQPAGAGRVLSSAADPGKYLAYLDVWEQEVNVIEDPAIRETALGGLDTCARTRVAWRVNLVSIDDINKAGTLIDVTNKKMPVENQVTFQWDLIAGMIDHANRGRLKVVHQAPTSDANPCIVSPSASFRGLENRLYRVEIHTGGVASRSREIDSASGIPSGVATFKWSRDNGSVVFPIANGSSGASITLQKLGADAGLDLKPDDWVELVHDHSSAHDRTKTLFQVTEVSAIDRRVTLSPPLPPIEPFDHPYLRRWDQRGQDLRPGGVMPVVEHTGLALEDGLQVMFELNSTRPATYRAGDFWYIPARTLGHDTSEDSYRPSDGVEHHYAPLAMLTFGGGNFTDPATLVSRIDASAHIPLK